MAGLKRKLPETKQQPPNKKIRAQVPEYHASPSIKDEDGNAIWPAPEDQMSRARDIILECAAAGKKTLIVPDKDADGLSSGVILWRTLILLGLSEDLLSVHLLSKGNTVHTPEERELMNATSASYIFVLDQGSRSAPPLLAHPHTALVIDHHHATSSDFPESAAYVTACNSPPVSTSSLLTYLLCAPLHPSVESSLAWLAIVGTHGDLGATFKWAPPFPDMSAPLKKHTKKALNDIVSLVNAPRRTAGRDVDSAWTALLSASKPQFDTQDTASAEIGLADPDLKSVLTNPRLRQARNEINDEVERCTHSAPKFSADGTIALLRISSPCQVHPVIATRWAGHLNSKALRIVMVANEGYLDDKVNFSCRIARCARARGDEVDIIETLRGLAKSSPIPDADEGDDGSQGSEGVKDERPLVDRLGTDFARGHVQASGGIVDRDAFEELVKRMRIGEKKAASSSAETTSPKKGGKGAEQKNTLMNYFAKPTATKNGKIAA